MAAFEKKYAQVVGMFLEGKKWNEIAREMDVGIATISRWKQTPEYREIHDRIVDDEIRQVRDRLLTASHEAVERLKREAENQDNFPTARIRANELLLRFNVLYDEHIDVKRRMHEFEDRIKQLEGNSGNESTN